MMHVYPDAETMRRRKQHYILDDSGDVGWTGPKMGSCLEWLYENGHEHFEVHVGSTTFRMELVRKPE